MRDAFIDNCCSDIINLRFWIVNVRDRVQGIQNFFIFLFFAVGSGSNLSYLQLAGNVLSKIHFFKEKKVLNQISNLRTSKRHNR